MTGSQNALACTVCCSPGDQEFGPDSELSGSLADFDGAQGLPSPGPVRPLPKPTPPPTKVRMHER